MNIFFKKYKDLISSGQFLWNKGCSVVSINIRKE